MRCKGDLAMKGSGGSGLGYGDGARVVASSSTESKGSSGASSAEGARSPEPTLSEFLMHRVFNFLHYYAGKGDPLGKAIEAEATRRKMKVKVTSCERDEGVDLLRSEPYKTHCMQAEKGLWDGFHSGFPCTSFSRLRWREVAGYPGPCRSKDHPYGLPTNSRSLQQECDEGTVHASRSIFIGRLILEAKTEGTIKPVVTLENPPPSSLPQHLSAWELPEIETFVKKHELGVAHFATCKYQLDIPVGERFLKPQTFKGSLMGIASLSGTCICGSGAKHKPILGKELSEASASYPKALCKAYARLLLDHYEKIGTLEYYKNRALLAEEELRLQRERRSAKRRCEEEEDEVVRATARPKGKAKQETTERGGAEDLGGEGNLKLEADNVSSSSKGDLTWHGGGKQHGMLGADRSRRGDPALLNFVGGMKDPAKVVAGMPAMQALGLRIMGAWDRFVKSNPEATKTAEAYGTDECELDQRTVEEWRAQLRRLVGSRPRAKLALKSKWIYVSPMQGELIEAWTRKGGDPDLAIAEWVKEGTPLGINLPIQCHGIFPAFDREQEEEWQADAITQLAAGTLSNYVSVKENQEDARIEVERIGKKGFAVPVKRAEVEREFSQGTISRLALIVKERPDKTKKRRLIIDLRRSGGNSKAFLPEKLVLPRAMDGVGTLRALHAQRADATTEEMREMWAREMILIDVSDAFPHLAVHERELEHCLAPAVDGSDDFVLFRALLFGFKTAPLLWSRVAAWTARVVQSCVPLDEGQHQVYLDDSFWCMQGTLARRNHLLGFILHTMSALGIEVSVRKGERGDRVVWAGVEFRLIERGTVLLTLPEKFILSVEEVLKGWTRGMAPLKELRTVTGKISWLSGVLTRAKWILRVFYAVLTAREAELRSGAEDRRRQLRADERDKSALFPVKRLEAARLALLEFLAVTKARPTRKISLVQGGQASVTIATDASPEGLGGVLIVNHQLIGALASPVTEIEAKDFEFELGTPASQGIVEALALVVALDHRGRKLEGMKVELTLQSDSVTALAMIHNKSASTPALNMLGASIGILLERHQVEHVKLQHVPGVANVVPDYLSRPSTWATKALPSALEGIKVASCKARGADFYPLPTPGRKPELWGASTREDWL